MYSGKELGSAIESAIVRKGIKKTELATHFGVKPPSVQDWINRGTIGKEKLPKLWEYFSDFCGPEHWGLTTFPQIRSSGSKFVVDNHVITQAPTWPASNTGLAAVGHNRIPVISYIQAGIWTEIVDNFQSGDAEEWLLTDIEHSACTFALTIRGNSMEPDFKEGDRVIIDPEVAPKPGSFVAAINGKTVSGEREATFKKYRPRTIDAAGNTVFELIPLNEDYPTIRSDEHPIEIIGTMVEHRRYFK